MSRTVALLGILFFPLFPNLAQAQAITTEVGVESTPVTEKRFIEVETQFQQGLPSLLEKIQEAGKYVKEDNYPASEVSLQAAKDELKAQEKVLGEESYYQEIKEQVIKMEVAFDRAEQAIAKRQKKVALRELAEVYRRGKVLAESPVLKLSAAEIALGNASRQIESGNYRGAGLFLQRAIDALTEIQNNPNIKSQDIAKLKNEIIVTQQQVTMGELQDEKKLKRFYPGLAAARVNALNTYYDIWTRSNEPWLLY